MHAEQVRTRLAVLYVRNAVANAARLVGGTVGGALGAWALSAVATGHAPRLAVLSACAAVGAAAGYAMARSIRRANRATHDAARALLEAYRLQARHMHGAGPDGRAGMAYRYF